ncbi:unnamed protein product [Rotaria socialis]|uniref:Fibronectin type-III domain-containing protein n=3 Tax=Rotaria socialis TaxID=392032 RepID=A0A818REN3_9BILA|nr:unnamed protein product [Rotaria socialis]CAF3656313.1 unnamed protein product [Rotaria socialis]CAF4104782.1 unnamed protein product [Rotaria socialis]
MQGYQQRLITFTLFITVAYGKLEIVSFDAKAPTDIIGPHSTIYDTHIELWAVLKDCPNSECSCTVNSPDLADDSYSVTFLVAPQKHIGYVQISDLKPITKYSFTLTCADVGSHPSLTIPMITDYGRPSAPANIASALNANKIKISWSPVTPSESFDHYRVTIDKAAIEVGKDNSYEMKENYVNGITHKIRVQACRKNKQGNILCSQSKNDEITFFVPTPPTVTPPVITASETPLTATATPPSTTSTTTTTKSMGVHSYSVSVLMIFLSLFFLS